MHLSQNRTCKCPYSIAKHIEIWESGALLADIVGTFDLVVVNIVLGSFSAYVSTLVS